MLEPEMDGPESDQKRYKVKYIPVTPRRGWCMREVTEDGEQIGTDYRPWDWILMFRAEEINYFECYETDGFLHDGSYDKQIILAKLVPTAFRDSPPRYTIMGFNRTVEDISLRITRTRGASSISCFADLKSTDELGRPDRPDMFGFKMSLEAERFDAIALLIRSRGPMELVMRIERADGFYAFDDNFSTLPDRIRILPGIIGTEGEFPDKYAEEVELELPADLEHKPPRTGAVGEFDLTASFNAKTDETQNSDDKEVETGDEYATTTDQHLYTDAMKTAIQICRENTSDGVNSLKRLRIPLWLLVVLLLLILLRI